MPRSRIRAPEFNSEDIWLNTGNPLCLSHLRGKFVLLDFWTYCCINCHHVLPDLAALESRYPNELVVIGVHSPKFSNEHRTESLKHALKRHGVAHPVVNDRSHRLWQAYAVKAWPTLVLIDPDGYIIETLPGEGHFDYLDEVVRQLIDVFDEAGRLDRKPLPFLDSSSVTSAGGPLRFPGKVLADSASQRLFIADSGHHRIVVTDFNGLTLDVIGEGKSGLQDAEFESARFNSPQGLALRDELLYVADTENHALRCCDLDRRSVSTVAGNGTRKKPFGIWEIEPAAEAALNSPWDLCMVQNLLFVAMAGLHQIWLFDLAAGEIGPYAGNGSEALRDGSLVECMLAQPSGITSNGVHLFVADSETSAIRAVPLDPRLPVTTVVGAGLFDFGDRDGEGAEVRLQHPLGLEGHASGLLVADTFNHRIKSLAPAERSIQSLFGSGKPGKADGNPGQFDEPGGLSVAGGWIFITDTNNHRICRAQSGGSVETLSVH